MFLTLAIGKKNCFWSSLLSHLVWNDFFPGAWSQRETTTLKHCLRLQMFLTLTFPVTTKVLIFFQKEHMNEWVRRTYYVRIIHWLICSASCSWQCHDFDFMMLQWKSASEGIVTPRDEEGSGFPANPSEGVGHSRMAKGSDECS